MFTIGLVGLPNAGKSSLFNLVTKQSVPAENFPFTTIDPNDAIVQVPDERLDWLAKMSNSQKSIPAIVEFRDIAGLIKDAHAGAGLGNKFLSHIREVDLILLVLRKFKNDSITHVENRISPVDDEEILLAELSLSDLKVIESALEKAPKALRTDPKGEAKLDHLQQLVNALNQLKLASTVEKPVDEELLAWRKSLNLLTDKPVLRLGNINHGGDNADYVTDFDIDIQLELDAVDMSDSDRTEFGLPLANPIAGLVTQCYTKLGLSSYLTTGEKETRAWTYPQGLKAPQCAAKIHSDFEKRFVKAEVIKYEDYKTYGTEKAVRDAGKLASVGKEYVMQDGDVVEFILS
jgi:ribosome-binding ATPase